MRLIYSHKHIYVPGRLATPSEPPNALRLPADGRPTGAPSGFTLVELLVVIAIIGVLVALSMPAVFSARETARTAYCANNLREMGIGLNSYASRKGAFCSGAFSWMYDGAVTQFGWVADLVAQGTQVGLLLCPSNPNQVSETYYDLLGTTVANLSVCNVTYDGSPPAHLPSDYDASGNLIANSQKNKYGSPCYQIVHDTTNTINQPNSAARLDMIFNGVFVNSYNTNYTAGWFLVRGGPRLDANGNPYTAPGCTTGPNQATYSPNFIDRNSSQGPLTSSLLDSGNVPSNTVPFLGCGAAAMNRATQYPWTPKTLPMQMGSIPQGAGLTSSFTRGPMQNGSTAALAQPSFPNNTSRNGPTGWWNSWAGGWGQAPAGFNTQTPSGPNTWNPPQILQDYRQFGAVHRGAYCNIVFADGSVRSVQDFNNDGQLNDGFPGTFPLSTSSTNGFTDGFIEIGPDVVYSSGSIQGL